MTLASANVNGGITVNGPGNLVGSLSGQSFTLSGIGSLSGIGLAAVYSNSITANSALTLSGTSLVVQVASGNLSVGSLSGLAAGGTLDLRAPGSIALPSVAVSGGAVNLVGSSVSFSSTNTNGSLVDVSSGSGAGGAINLFVTGSQSYTLTSSLLANGTTGGAIAVSSPLAFINQSSIEANGSSGDGGLVLIEEAGATPSGTFVVVNNGTISAASANPGGVGTASTAVPTQLRSPEQAR